MEIEKEITVTISPSELSSIIVEYLKATKNINVESVHFDINGHNDEDDWRAEYPLVYTLDGVICKGIDN